MTRRTKPDRTDDPGRVISPANARARIVFDCIIILTILLWMDTCPAPADRLLRIIVHACQSYGEDEFSPHGPVINGSANAPLRSHTGFERYFRCP